MNKQKGFTIIELIVVIAIIAVLAAIIMTNVMSYVQRAKVARFLSDAHQVSIAATCILLRIAIYYRKPVVARYNGLYGKANNRRPKKSNIRVEASRA